MLVVRLSGWKTGLEPATFGTTIRRSNRLSYNHHVSGCKDNTAVLFMQTNGLKKIKKIYFADN